MLGHGNYGTWILDEETDEHSDPSSHIYRAEDISIPATGPAQVMRLPTTFHNTDQDRKRKHDPSGVLTLLDVVLRPGKKVSRVSEELLEDDGIEIRRTKLPDGTTIKEGIRCMLRRSGRTREVLVFHAERRYVDAVGRNEWVIALKEPGRARIPVELCDSSGSSDSD